jgi:hypothetical protein
MPHVPQLATSVLVSTHFAPHLVGAAAMQSDTQVCCPPTVEQSGLATSHIVPHFPQLDEVVSGVSQSGFPSQFPQPGLQVMAPHAPLLQVALPLVTAQLLPHVPQLLPVVSEVSQPGSVEQSPKPSLHFTITQALFTHAASALARLQA